MGQGATLCLNFSGCTRNSITTHMIEIKLNQCIDMKRLLFRKLDDLEIGAAVFFKGYSVTTLRVYCLEWSKNQPERVKFHLLEVSQGVCIKKIKKRESRRNIKYGVHARCS